ncbi:hypothetical protein JCM19241_5211 [Vibrio ishigakensis]|uniref:Uncharacterized protein n=1 Tax=Vibrio ishigakensis TaxID=1481914 RepID=A0A0B8Q369_9VIBR|nr:hypothetical protein JCM19241_5211 [Vibrio ishigakensis]
MNLNHSKANEKARTYCADEKDRNHNRAHDLELEIKSLLFEIIESARLDSMCEARNLSGIASARVEELSRLAKR